MIQPNNPARVDVAVVGAGAAGLATGIFCARADRSRDDFAAARVPLAIAILDGARKPGAKILVSGGGRCNVTNSVVTPDDFRGGNRHFIRNVLRAFSVPRTIAFFREIGVALHEEECGKLFPDTHKARTVLDALLAEAGRLGARILPAQRVTDIVAGAGACENTRADPADDRGTDPRGAAERRAPGGYVLTCCAADGATTQVVARRVVLATGGLSLPKTGSDGCGYELARRLGHSIVPTTPALVPLVLEGDFHTDLSGVAHSAELALHVASEKARRFRGSLLWTHFGISGPAALDASGPWHWARLGGGKLALTMSFAPGEALESLERRMVEIATREPRATLRAALIGLCSASDGTVFPARVAEAILARLSLSPTIRLAHLPREQRRLLVRMLLDWPLAVVDSRGFAHAEVTAGGVALDEVDSATLESRKSAGLHFVGEILDVDGRLGGFNFQWAWSTGFAAGAAIARMQRSR